MITGQKKADTIKKAGDYITHRINGANKQDSAVKAGYAESTARNPTLIERTKAYQVLVDKILIENANTMFYISSNLHKLAASGELNKLREVEQAQIYKIMTDANDKLIPKVTLKQSTDKNGNITRTAWAQNASQVQEVLADEQGG